MPEESIHFDVGGSGTFSASGAPYNTGWWTSKVQYLLLNSELSSFGFSSNSKIRGLSFRCSQVPGRALANFYIRMRHFEPDTLESSWITEDFTLLYHETNIPTSAFTVGDWFRHDFNQGPEEFTWNGTDNILIDVIRVDTDYTSGGGNYVRTGLPSRRMIFGYQDSGSSYPGETLTVRTTRETEIIDTIIHGDLDLSVAEGSYTSQPYDLTSFGATEPTLKIKWKDFLPDPDMSSVTIQTAAKQKLEGQPVEPDELDWITQANGTAITGLPIDLTDTDLWVRIVLSRDSLEIPSPTVDWLVVYDLADNPDSAIRINFDGRTKIAGPTGIVSFTDVMERKKPEPYIVYTMSLESEITYNYTTAGDVLIDGTKAVDVTIEEWIPEIVAATAKGSGVGKSTSTYTTSMLDGYELERSDGGQHNWNLIAVFHIGSSGWVDTGPFEQTTYYYRIRRARLYDYSDWSNIVSVEYIGEGEIVGSFTGHGVGSILLTTTNIVIAFSRGTGAGDSTQSGKVTVLGNASASGYGEGSSFAEVISIAPVVDASAHGTGIGNATVNAVPLVLSMVYGTGVGGTYPNAYIENISAVSGSGVGTPNVHPELLIVSSFEGFGVGGTAVLSAVEILSSVTASGIGNSTARSIVDVVVSAKGSGVGSSRFEASAIIYGSIAATGQGQAEVFTENIILTMTYGSGVGGTYPNSIVIILPSTFASGIGASTIENFILFVTGNFIGAGVGTGQISSETITPMVESSAEGSGEGFGQATGSPVKSASAHGSGEGTGEASSIVNVTLGAIGSGIGKGLSFTHINVVSSIYGSGIGIGFTITDVIGLVAARVKGHGTGLGEYQSIVDLLQKVYGSGVGLGATQIAAFSILENSAAGSGIGNSNVESTNITTASAKGSGQGTALNKGIVSVSIGAAGTGAGNGQTITSVTHILSAIGNGIGIGIATGKTSVTGIFKAQGIGTSATVSRVAVNGQFIGNGIGKGSASEEIVGIITSSSAGSGNGNGKVSPVTIVTASGKGSGEGTGWSGAQKITAQNIQAKAVSKSDIAGRKIVGNVISTTIETEITVSGNVVDLLDGQVIAEVISKSSVIGRKIAKYELNIAGHNRISIESSKTSKTELKLVITSVTTTGQSSTRTVHIYGTATIDVVIDSGRKIIHTDYDEYCRLYEMPLDFSLHPIRLEFELKEVDLCIR